MVKFALLLSLALAQDSALAAPDPGFSDQSEFADEQEAPAPAPTMGFRDISEFADESKPSTSAVAIELFFGGVLVLASGVLLAPIAAALFLVARQPVIWARDRLLPRAP